MQWTDSAFHRSSINGRRAKIAFMKSKGRSMKKLRAYQDCRARMMCRSVLIDCYWKCYNRRGADVACYQQYWRWWRNADSNELDVIVGRILFLSWLSKVCSIALRGNKGAKPVLTVHPALFQCCSSFLRANDSVHRCNLIRVHVRFTRKPSFQLADSNEYHNFILDANERIFEEW